MEPLLFILGISNGLIRMGSLELLKTICVILSFGLEKVSQKYLKNYVISYN
jgi:hypothetical protein